jgi:hypothetical protein
LTILFVFYYGGANFNLFEQALALAPSLLAVLLCSAPQTTFLASPILPLHRNYLSGAVLSGSGAAAALLSQI